MRLCRPFVHDGYPSSETFRRPTKSRHSRFSVDANNPVFSKNRVSDTRGTGQETLARWDRGATDGDAGYQYAGLPLSPSPCLSLSAERRRQIVAGHFLGIADVKPPAVEHRVIPRFAVERLEADGFAVTAGGGRHEDHAAVFRLNQ